MLLRKRCLSDCGGGLSGVSSHAWACEWSVVFKWFQGTMILKLCFPDFLFEVFIPTKLSQNLDQEHSTK